MRQVGNAPAKDKPEESNMADTKSATNQNSKTTAAASKPATPARDEDGRFTEKTEGGSSKSTAGKSGTKGSASKSR